MDPHAILWQYSDEHEGPDYSTYILRKSKSLTATKFLGNKIFSAACNFLWQLSTYNKYYSKFAEDVLLNNALKIFCEIITMNII